MSEIKPIHIQSLRLPVDLAAKLKRAAEKTVPRVSVNHLICVILNEAMKGKKK
jgi:hypothetical protein